MYQISQGASNIDSVAFEKALSNRKIMAQSKGFPHVNTRIDEPYRSLKRNCVIKAHYRVILSNISLLDFKALENYVYSQYDTIQTYDTFSLI